MNILVIEDDPFISRAVAEALQGEVVQRTASLQSGLSHLAGADVVVLDLNLADSRGPETLDAVRARSPRVPIIVISAIDQHDVRVRTLHHGADDYLTKPFSLEELTARINAVMRRAAPRPAPSSGLTWDAPARQLSWQSEPIPLTPLEYEVFEVLAKNPGVAFSRPDILRRVIGPNFYGYERVVDVHVGHLRRKLAVIGEEAVLTVRAYGYRWNPDVRVEDE